MSVGSHIRLVYGMEFRIPGLLYTKVDRRTPPRIITLALMYIASCHALARGTWDTLLALHSRTVPGEYAAVAPLLHVVAFSATVIFQASVMAVSLADIRVSLMS